MKCLILSAVIGAALFVSGCSTGSVKSTMLAAHSETTLKNGLHILTIPNHSLPYVSIGLMVRTGTADDPISKSGLASLTASLLSRGTKTHSALQIADEFALLGSEFSSDANRDFMYFSSAALAKDQSKLLDLFFEVITQPTFNKQEVDRRRHEVLAEIRRDYDQPAWVASRIFAQSLYGSHPYARAGIGTLRDVASIHRNDVVQFYSSVFVPNNCDLVLVGDWDPKTTAALESRLSNWQSKALVPPVVPQLAKIHGENILFVNRAGLKQTEIRIGHFGIRRKNDDYQALSVADVILSEGFNSRLVREIRVNKGLTYGIDASFEALKDIGPFVVTTNTRNEKTGEVVADTIQVLKDFRDKGVTDQEVADAKSYLRGTFPQRIETPSDLASQLMALRFYGVSESYLVHYDENLDRISSRDVNHVIKKYFHPNNMRIVVYGPKSPDLAELRPLGAVEVKSFKELAVGL